MVSVESGAAAVATAAWALAAARASKREIAAAFAVVGVAAAMATVAMSDALRWPVVVLLAVLLAVYQTLLAEAFAVDGARAQAVVNLNVVIVVAASTLLERHLVTPASTFSPGTAAAMVLYALLGLYVAGYIALV